MQTNAKPLYTELQPMQKLCRGGDTKQNKKIYSYLYFYSFIKTGFNNDFRNIWILNNKTIKEGKAIILDKWC